ncbi:toxin-antitoxin system YwqK family antitoxin [Zobellia laminariae]|uniref:toxin-antitoxin system YwqK family antitoxin n=1 Tax=Zobellia laminariae TaxID=248906 RepID=UPI0012D92BD1|nr:toxin-antitoxin system YwqK family antitoxin [Zobellia laminariae]
MKLFYFMLFLMLSLASCKESKEVEPKVEGTIVIKNFEVHKKDLVLDQLEGRWYYKNEPFNGYSIKSHDNGAIGERLGYVDGKREGIFKQWSSNHVLRVQSYYKHNRLDGIYKTWWENGTLSEESHYVDGVLHGTQKHWYDTGEIAKERNLVEGKEQGMQKAWLKNGKLYVNYEAKNGRIFGMRRANSCYKLKDEVVIRDKKI